MTAEQLAELAGLRAAVQAWRPIITLAKKWKLVCHDKTGSPSASGQIKAQCELAEAIERLDHAERFR